MPRVNPADGTQMPSATDPFDPNPQLAAYQDGVAKYNRIRAYADASEMNSDPLATGGWFGFTEDTKQVWLHDGDNWILQNGDTEWITPTLSTGSNISGNPFGYRRVRIAEAWQLHLRGRVGSLSASAVMFELPPGFRPDAGDDNVIRLDTGASSESRVNFKSNGEIEIVSWSGGSITFTGVTFLVAP